MFEVSILIMILIFMFGGFIKGWSGFGTNLVVPPLLGFMAYFGDPKQAMVIVVSVNLFLNLAILIQSKKFNLDLLKSIWVLVVFGVLFNFVGAFFFSKIDDSWFRILLGLMIIIVTINRMFKLKFVVHHPEKYYIPMGIVSGILNGMFGLGGLPLLIVLGSSKMDKDVFKSTLVSYFFVMNIIYIISQGVIGGYYDMFVFTHIMYVIVFAVFATILGVYVSKRVSDQVFQRVMNVVLLFFGLNLIYFGIFKEHIFSLLQL